MKDRQSKSGKPTTATPVKGPASYFPSIEKKYGRPIADWQNLIRKQPDKKHMEIVGWLKREHGMGHGHANALVGYTLAQDRKDAKQT
jgi:hypothetical protein